VVDRRGLIAGVLGFLYPGLGHAYLRAWIRAVAWFGLAVVTAALVVPDSAYQAFEARGFQGVLDASESFGSRVTLSLLLVRLFSVVDAYVLAVKQSSPATAETDAATGPSFCPWCTQRLKTPADPDADPE
jgi:hypothetical protein